MGDLQVFVCHSTDPGSLALLASVREYRPPQVHFWVAEEMPRPGTRISEKVIKAIKESDVVLVILTPKAVESPWVNQELALAVAHGRPIVPIKTRDAQVRGIIEGLECIEINPDNPTWALSHVASVLEQMRREGRDRSAAVHLTSRRERPLGVTVLAAMMFLAGGFMLLFSIGVVAIVVLSVVRGDPPPPQDVLYLGIAFLVFPIAMIGPVRALYAMKRSGYFGTVAVLSVAAAVSVYVVTTSATFGFPAIAVLFAAVFFLVYLASVYRHFPPRSRGSVI